MTREDFIKELAYYIEDSTGLSIDGCFEFAEIILEKCERFFDGN